MFCGLIEGRLYTVHCNMQKVTQIGAKIKEKKAKA